MEEKRWWRLDVNNYGEWAFWGTRAEAEDTLNAKREWEGEDGWVYPDTPDQQMISNAIRYDHGGVDPAVPRDNDGGEDES